MCSKHSAPVCTYSLQAKENADHKVNFLIFKVKFMRELVCVFLSILHASNADDRINLTRFLILPVRGNVVAHQQQQQQNDKDDDDGLRIYVNHLNGNCVFRFFSLRSFCLFFHCFFFVPFIITTC